MRDFATLLDRVANSKSGRWAQVTMSPEDFLYLMEKLKAAVGVMQMHVRNCGIPRGSCKTCNKAQAYLIDLQEEGQTWMPPWEQQ